MSIFVAAIDVGMGDVFISLPVIQALIDRSDSDVYLVTRSFRQHGLSARVSGLKGEIAEACLNLQAGDRYINLRDHPLQTDHDWSSPEFAIFFGPPSIEKIITAIAADLNITPDFAQLAPLLCNKISGLEKTIILVPGTDGFHKFWPVPYWLDLAAAVQEKEFSVAMLGEIDNSPPVQALAEAGIKLLPTAAIGSAIDIISSCRAVVAVDTGLMHIAVQQGIPTFTFIHQRNIHHRSAANCHIFNGSSCKPVCRNQRNPDNSFSSVNNIDVSRKFNRIICQVAIEESCMGTITAEAVLSKMSAANIFV